MVDNNLYLFCLVIFLTFTLPGCNDKSPDAEEKTSSTQQQFEQNQNNPATSVSEADPQKNNKITLEIASPWNVSIRLQQDKQVTLITAISHKDGYLAVWSLDKQRQPQLLARDIVGFHPDSANWVDWDSDGEADEILVAAEGDKSIQWWRYTEGKLEKLATTFIDLSARNLVSADFDQDKKPDIVVGPYDGDEVTLLWGKENFTFQPSKLEAQPIPMNPKLVDWDKDGELDIVWSDRNVGSVRWARYKGNREFEITLLQKPGPGIPRQVITGYINDDDFPDLILPLEAGKAARILYNDGQGGIASSEEIPSPKGGYKDAAIGKVDGNPLLALSEDGMIVLAQRNEGTWQLRQLKISGLSESLQFIDADYDGVLDLILAYPLGKGVEVLYGPLWEQAVDLVL